MTQQNKNVPPTDSSKAKAEQARVEAEQLGQNAKQKAAEVKDTAAEATTKVTGQAKQEAQQVATEAQDQIRGLVDTTLGEVRGRASEGQTALAGTVGSLSQELQQLTRESSASGPVAQFAGDIASRGEQLASWLENHEPDDVLVEVRRFAARKPTTFLALAAGAGLIAGRLARGTRDLSQDEQQRPAVAPAPRGQYQVTEPVRSTDRLTTDVRDVDAAHFASQDLRDGGLR
ncbi:hypothetical protein AAEX63_06645 [Luteococcus sp. H138]|uniref:hypothetical protein n=1 Tax=unclassified Luteococcus TaxID=2639923 RepID=UPI00313E7301